MRREVNNMAQSKTRHTRPVDTVDGSTSLVGNPAQHGEKTATNVERETILLNNASKTNAPHML